MILSAHHSSMCSECLQSEFLLPCLVLCPFKAISKSWELKAALNSPDALIL